MMLPPGITASPELLAFLAGRRDGVDDYQAAGDAYWEARIAETTYAPQPHNGWGAYCDDEDYLTAAEIQDALTPPMPAPEGTNPEQAVCDEIDRLVNESLEARRMDDYSAPFKDTCDLCGWAWHGLSGDGGQNGHLGCPGAYATQEQRDSWENNRPGQAIHHTIGNVTHADIDMYGTVIPHTHTWQLDPAECPTCMHDARRGPSNPSPPWIQQHRARVIEGTQIMHQTLDDGSEITYSWTPGDQGQYGYTTVDWRRGEVEEDTPD